MAKSDFEKMLDNVPECGPLQQVVNWVSPLHGVEIQQLSGGNLLESSQFRSTVVLHSPQGPIPIAFEIPASTVHEAQLAWKAAAQQAIREFDSRVRASQRRIVVPGVAANQLPMRVS
jgi:hypothetical protein